MLVTAEDTDLVNYRSTGTGRQREDSALDPSTRVRHRSRRLHPDARTDIELLDIGKIYHSEAGTAGTCDDARREVQELKRTVCVPRTRDRLYRYRCHVDQRLYYVPSRQYRDLWSA